MISSDEKLVSIPEPSFRIQVKMNLGRRSKTRNDGVGLILHCCGKVIVRSACSTKAWNELSASADTFPSSHGGAVDAHW